MEDFHPGPKMPENKNNNLERAGDATLDRQNHVGYFEKINQLGYRHGFSYSDANMSFGAANSNAERVSVSQNINTFLQSLYGENIGKQISIIPNFLEKRGEIIFIGDKLPDFLSNSRLVTADSIPSLQSAYPQDSNIQYPGIIEQQTDVVLTSLENVNLQLLSRDCIAAVLVIKKQEIAVSGLLHAGWKQVDGLVGKRLVDALTSTDAIRPEDIQVAIAPCLRKDNATLDNLAGISDESLWADFIEKRGDKYHLDFVGAFKKQLTESGIPSGNILDCGIDTYAAQAEHLSNSQRFQRAHNLQASRIVTTLNT